MSAMASQITEVSIVYSTVCSSADQRKHQSSSSLAFVRGSHWCPVNSPHKGPVTRKMFYDVIMEMTFAELNFFFKNVKIHLCFPSFLNTEKAHGPHINIKTVFPCMGFHYKDKTVTSLIFIMGIPIPVRPHLYIGTVVEILPRGRRARLSSMCNAWLLRTWRCMGPGHQRPWYWHFSLGIFCF